MTFKPQAILPDPDFRGSAEDTPLSHQEKGTDMFLTFYFVNSTQHTIAKAVYR